MNFFMAERGGFEPPKAFDGFTGLANQRTRPLCDLSKAIIDTELLKHFS